VVASVRSVKYAFFQRKLRIRDAQVTVKSKLDQRKIVSNISGICSLPPAS